MFDSCWFRCAWILCGSSVWIIEPSCILSHCTSCSHWISKGSTTSALALLPQCKKHKDFGHDVTSSKKLWLGSLLDIWQPWDLFDAPFWLLKAFYALPLPCPLPRKNMKKIKAYKSGKKHQTGLNFWTTMGRCGLLHMLKFTCVTFLCLYFHADCILSDLLCSF